MLAYYKVEKAADWNKPANNDKEDDSNIFIFIFLIILDIDDMVVIKDDDEHILFVMF